MKTSIDIPENELNDVLSFTGARTKREAINIAISSYNRLERLKRLSQKLGSFKNFITPSELNHLRAK